MRFFSNIVAILLISLPLTAANLTTTPLSAADRELIIVVAQSQVARAAALLTAGANVNSAQPPLQLTPLLVASELDFDMVKLLVERGAEVNVNDRDGITPLMRAITLRDLRMVKLLLDAGAKIDVTDYRGHTALTHAILRSDADILKLLITRGAKTDIVTAMGTTSWSIAQRMREAALVMPERLHDKPHNHGQSGHAMRSKPESLFQSQAVLDVLVEAKVKQRPQQPVAFDAMKYHRH